MKKLHFPIILFLLFVGNFAVGQVIEFKDEKFKNKLLSANTDNEIAKDKNGNSIKIDVNDNGEIEVLEAQNVYFLNISRGYSNGSTQIDNIDEIANFINLQELICSSNNLSSIDISKNQNITRLNCNYNNLGQLDVTKNTEISILSCNNNKLTEINVSNNEKLSSLDCSYNELSQVSSSNCKLLSNLNCESNKLQTIEIVNNKMLETLNFRNNQVTIIDLSTNVNLKELKCSKNKLLSLNLSEQSLLEYLDCSGNELTSLDLNFCNVIKRIYASSNNLRKLYIKNGSLFEHVIRGNPMDDIYYFVIDNNPDLKYICIDDSNDNELMLEENFVRAAISPDRPLYNINLNTYCTFNPGGKYHTIDLSMSKCDQENSFLPFKKMKIDNGVSHGLIYTNLHGKYIRGILETNQTVTPIMENPEYYSVTPESLTITFPNESKETIQNFCFSPKKEVKDLEVVVVPVGTPARPGFDTDYRIIYKNKGTKTLNGTIHLKYFDDVLDYVTATTVPFGYRNYELVWNYDELKPFETRSIKITFNVNSPMETPAVNNGDLLNFTASINFDGTDETPEDNSHELRQTVVGSYDPNDKTCLEGTDVLPEMIGEYVHYRIRFENTGTFAAENIVVVDEIDESKFDVSTLVPLDASHDFETRIKGNKVEFIFEGIQLPFDDATNDGYVIFKIKTLPTLKLGDSFSNQASIYFDFNFPIITNNETTTIVEEHLGVGDFDFNEELTVYPNPVADRLYITPKNNAQIQSLEIYNLEGQLILSVPQVSKMSFDVSHLPKGTYLVKVKTDRGMATTKVVKE